jgi:signal transduction histidine kinase
MLVKLARDELDTGDIRLHIDAGTCSILADPLFSKVLSYLIDNAVRHGKKTTEIRISLQYAGGYAVLFIEDNGAGIVPEDKEKIFEKGYGKYTGWGLFVAREILAANGMTIRETGEPGKGARFEIAVPQERVRFKTGAAAQ